MPPPTSPPARPNHPHLGALLTMASMLGFACMDSLSKLLVHDYPIAQTLWVRYGIFTVFALLIVRRGGIGKAARSARPLLQAGRSLLGVVENGVFVLAFLYLPLADTHAVAATSPLIVIALSALFLGEQVRMKRWCAVAAGFAGVLLIIRPGFQVLSWPLLLPLGGAMLWAVYQVLTRLCARNDTPDTTLLWTAAIGFAATTLIGPWQWHAPDTTGWILIGGIALLGSVSHYALIRALDFAEAAAVQPYSYTLLVWATVLGVIVFGDIPDWWTLAGAAIVVLSGLYTWYEDRMDAARRPTATPSAAAG